MPGAKNHVSVHARNGFFEVSRIGVTPTEFKVSQEVGVIEDRGVLQVANVRVDPKIRLANQVHISHRLANGIHERRFHGLKAE